MTYYKLNREKLERYSICMRMILDMLTDEGILEEVQEEEVAKEYASKQIMQDVGADLVQGDGTGKVKHNPYVYEQTTMERCACGCTQKYPHSHLVAGKRCECEEGRDTKVNAGEFEYNEDIKKLYKQYEPFLDGMKPSEFVNEGRAFMNGYTDSNLERLIKVVDLLVEELKKSGYLK